MSARLRSGPTTSLPKGTVTFLLTDIEGSTGLWQQSPDAMRTGIKRHDALVASAIEEHQGIVLKDRGEGDSFFAVFQRATDGVAAACSIQRALHAESWPEGIHITVRIAIHSGEAHEELAEDYRGTVVNRCARLRALARGGQVLLSASAGEIVRDSLPVGITLGDLGHHALRDFPHPEHVFQVVDAGGTTDLLDAAEMTDTLVQAPGSRVVAAAVPVLMTLCPIVIGRDPELSRLQAAIDEAQRGIGQVVVIVGEAGCGKTRLVTEVQERAQGAGLQILWGACSEAAVALPYLPFVEAIGNYLGGSDLLALTRMLGPMARELAQLFPQLSAQPLPPNTSDPGPARLRLFEAVVALLRIAAEPGGLVLVVEDVHWADASTLELLDYLTRRLRQSRTVVVATMRGEVPPVGHPLTTLLPAWRRGGHVLELPPLEPDGVGGMVSAIFDQAIGAEFCDFLHARTDGNPFVIEEMLKSAMDLGEIYRTELGWERKALTDLTIPPTVREIILQRLSRLDTAKADVVRTASVLGESFTYEALTNASGAPESLVRETLRESVRQQLMEAESDQRFRFRHALTRLAIYEDLIGPERAARHYQTATALREIAGIPSAEIAHHLALAGRWDEAVPELMRAADEAKSRGGYREAAELYEQALPHVVDVVLEARLVCRQAEVLYLVAAPTPAQALLERGIPVLEHAGHLDEAAAYRLILGSCHWLAGRRDQAKAEFDGVRANLEASAPSETLARAYAWLALFALDRSEVEDGARLADQAIRTAGAVGADRARIQSLTYRGCCLAEGGSIDAGLLDLERSWREALDRGLWDSAGIALSNAIHQMCRAFRASQAAPLFDRLKSLPELVHTGGRLATWIYLRRALTGIVLGDMASARVGAAEGLRLAREGQSAVMLIPEFTSFSAVAECAIGRASEAASLVNQLSQTLAADEQEVSWAAMRVLLDMGETRRAVQHADVVMNHLRKRARLVVFDAWLIDKGVEVYLAAHLPDQAGELRIMSEAVPRAAQPLIDRIEGRIALFRGDVAAADARLEAAAAFFQHCGYGDDEWRTRRVLAEVKSRRGDAAAAEHELRLVMNAADEHGHVFEATAARTQLQDLERRFLGAKPIG